MPTAHLDCTQHGETGCWSGDSAGKTQVEPQQFKGVDIFALGGEEAPNRNTDMKPSVLSPSIFRISGFDAVPFPMPGDPRVQSCNSASATALQRK